jgi:hypothetical protein
MTKKKIKIMSHRITKINNNCLQRDQHEQNQLRNSDYLNYK